MDSWMFSHMLLFAIALSLTSANLEGDALYALRRAVNDPEGVLQSWDPTLVDPCTWFHVTCDADNRVTRLLSTNPNCHSTTCCLHLIYWLICLRIPLIKLNSDLGNAKLSGKIVPELGKLEHLQYLELYMNNLMGWIPSELGQLKNLVSLDLYHNNLTGSIPPSFSRLSYLKFLRLNGNNLTGRIPRELTKLGNLKIFDVSSNDLCGTIPTYGSFSKFTDESFTNNSRLEGPELVGFVRYDVGDCN